MQLLLESQQVVHTPIRPSGEMKVELVQPAHTVAADRAKTIAIAFFIAFLLYWDTYNASRYAVLGARLTEHRNPAYRKWGHNTLGCHGCGYK